MALTCGLKPRHAPHSLWKRFATDHNFLSDTPIYCPFAINEFCQNEKLNCHFIYIDREWEDLFQSWKNSKLFANYESMKKNYLDPNYNKPIPYDFIAYQSAFNGDLLNEQNYASLFETHKTTVFDIIKAHNKPLLVYSFNQGWEPFCNFIEKDVPSDILPHLNKGKMLDKIV